MSKWNKGLVAAMEELDEVTEPVEVVDSADSLETGMIEANEVGAELDDMERSIEDAVEGAEEIEAIADTLGETIEEGGADPVTARVAEVAVESIYKRLGITKRDIPSMESFGTRSSRAHSTKVAVEGLQERAKAIWEKIVKAVKKAVQWVKDFFAKIFDANARLRSRAQSLLKQAEASGGKKAEKTKISTGGWANVLTLGDGFKKNTAYQAVDMVTEMTAYFGDVAVSLSNVAKSVSISTIEKMMASPKESKEDVASGLNEDTVYPGGKKFEFKEGTYFKKGGIQLTGEATVTDKEVEIAAVQDIKKIASGVLKLSDQLDKNKKQVKAAQDALDAIGKLGDSAVKMAKEDNKDGEPEMMKLAIAAARESASLLTSVAKISGAYSITVGKAALDYAEKSLNQYD